jgi:hypothetical protein
MHNVLNILYLVMVYFVPHKQLVLVYVYTRGKSCESYEKDNTTKGYLEELIVWLIMRYEND